MPEPKIGIVTFVHGWYLNYLPTFIFCINRAYPNYKIKIFVRGYVPEELWSLFGNAEIVENYMLNRGSNDPEKPPYYLRFLIPHSDLAEFDQVFICDVDLLMLSELPSLCSQRSEIMRKIGLPFANYLRDRHAEWPERFTGWHYIDVGPYFEKVQSVIDRIPVDFDITDIPHYSYGDGFGGKRYGQESLLYYILTNAFDFNQEDLRASKIAFPTHHGAHLGPMRSNLFDRFKSQDPAALSHFALNAVYWNSEQLSKIATDPKFLELFDALPKSNAKEVLQKFVVYYGAGV